MTNCAIHLNIENCKNACLFCNIDGFKESDKKDSKEVALHIYKQAIDLRKKGFLDAELTGHDPIQFEKIVGLIMWLKKIGFQKIILATHGRDLCDVQLVKKLSRINLLTLKIPLYGSHAKIHESVTQSKGSFKETIQGIKNIKEYAPNITLEFHTLIMKQNFDDIENILLLFAQFQPYRAIVKLPFIAHTSFAQKGAVSYSSLKPLVQKVFNLCQQKFDNNFVFADIPYCIFGFYDNHIIEDRVPPMAENYSVPEAFKTERHGVPKYRLKQKLKICKACKYNNTCNGFIKDYVEFFNMEQDTLLQPLK